MAGPWDKYTPSAQGPWSKYTPEPEPAGPSTGAGEAALEHYGNTATLGYLPHLQALTEKLLPNPSAEVDEKLRSQGFSVPDSDSNYLESRDANLKRLELEGKEHPVASAIGTGAGMAASALLPAGAAAEGATLGAKVAQGAKLGAAYGALANPGDKEGEIEPLQLGGRAKDAAFGSALGGAVPLAAHGIEKGASKVADYLRNKAALKASRALGRPTPAQAAKMAATGQDAELGRELLDSGAVPVLGTPKRIAGRVEGLKEKAGQEIGDLLERGGDSKVVDAEKLGIEILDSPELAAMRKTPGMESTAAAIEKQVETLAKNGQMTLKEAQALRQGIDRSINFNKAAPELRGAQEGLYQQRTAIRDAMNEGINNLNPSAPKDQLLAANRRYGNLSTASDILDREIGRDQANRAVSLSDTIAGAAGLTKGGPLGAAVMAGLNKAGRTFGNSAQARVYDAISKKLPAVAAGGAKMNANPLIAQAIAQRLGQGAPRFEEDTDSVLKNPQLMDIFRKDPSRIDAIQDDRIRNLVKRALRIGRSPATGGTP